VADVTRSTGLGLLTTCSALVAACSALVAACSAYNEMFTLRYALLYT